MNYSDLIKKSTNIDELSKVKELFLNECNVQEKKFTVAKEISSVKTFGDIKNLYESILPQLFKLSEGRKNIKKFVNVIKENESLKKEYILHESIKENKGKINGELYLNEALEIIGNVDKNTLNEGISKLLPILVESMKLIGVSDINWISKNEKTSKLNESIEYLLTTPKNIFNISEQSKNAKVVSDFISLSEANDYAEPTISLDSTLSDIFKSASKKINESEEDFYNEIDKSENKEELFENYKSNCLNRINELSTISDEETLNKLNEMKERLNEKKYDFSSITNDIIAMKDLQGILTELWENR